jgi:hypothetical protein
MVTCNAYSALLQGIANLAGVGTGTYGYVPGD